MPGMRLGDSPLPRFGAGMENHKKCWDRNEVGVIHPKLAPLPT